MKKIALVSIAVVLALALAGCSLFDRPKLAFFWNETLDGLYDENPSTPSTVYNGEYFATDEGTFNAAYSTVYDDGYSFSYTISKHDDDSLATQTYFELDLLSTGPALYYVVQDRVGGEAVSREMLNAPFEGCESSDGPFEGQFDVDRGGYRLHVEYRKLN